MQENFRFWPPSGRQRFLVSCGGVTYAIILFTFLLSLCSEKARAAALKNQLSSFVSEFSEFSINLDFSEEIISQD